MVTQSAAFKARIVPHRSLSPTGMRVVVGMVCGLSALTSSLFWWLGAWPVAGFSGAEVLAAVMMIRHNQRARRECEMIALYPDQLHIVRIDRHGRRTERSLATAWLNLLLEERQGRVPALILARHGTWEEIATQLGEPEKRALYEAFGAALHQMRHPRFHNPQLDFESH